MYPPSMENFSPRAATGSAKAESASGCAVACSANPEGNSAPAEGGSASPEGRSGKPERLSCKGYSVFSGEVTVPGKKGRKTASPEGFTGNKYRTAAEENMVNWKTGAR